jgi:flagella basal body P-ring formation protein FlgA
MEDGVPGDLIKAKNVSSGIVVDARVADNGTLIIGEP